jgi:hypothetical protein
MALTIEAPTLIDILNETGDYSEWHGDGCVLVFTTHDTRKRYFRLADYFVSGSYSGNTLGLIPKVLSQQPTFF